MSLHRLPRGDDLLGSTARQIVLARALGMASPRWLHLPIVVGPDGEKLSKQNGAAAVDASRPLEVLGAALRHLGIVPPPPQGIVGWLADATLRWSRSRCSNG